MIACTDEREFDWIRTAKAPLLPREVEEGSFIAHLMPDRFEAYAKILHWIEPNYEHIDRPLTEREDILLKIPACTQLKTFIENLRKQGPSNRVRWREIADLLGVAYQPAITHAWFRKRLEEGCWPRFLNGPAEGFLDSAECEELVSILAPFTKQDCFFRFFPILLADISEHCLFRGSLADALNFKMSQGQPITPEHWWPEDRSWCVCCDYDLNFTFVGGPRELIATLLRATVLETIEVPYQTRIDDFAPMH